MSPQQVLDPAASPGSPPQAPSRKAARSSGPDLPSAAAKIVSSFIIRPHSCPDLDRELGVESSSRSADQEGGVPYEPSSSCRIDVDWTDRVRVAPSGSRVDPLQNAPSVRQTPQGSRLFSFRWAMTWVPARPRRRRRCRAATRHG